MPFKQSALTYRSGQVHFCGKPLSLWDSYGLGDYELGEGNFSEDARGRWYINVTVKKLVWPRNLDIERVAVQPLPRIDAPQDETLSLDTCPIGGARTIVGIDLGLKDFLTTSDGTSIEARKIYRCSEPALATAQRARKAHRVRAIHAKIGNQRKDFHHKLSTLLVARHSAIFAGNVSASGLVQTKLAKSVLDAGWSAFRTMLQYKSDSAGVWFQEVEESYTTQDCSFCAARTGPRGLKGLSVRRWTCSSCHTEHDRDVNAATNIKLRGLVELGKVFPIENLPPQGVAVEMNEKRGVTVIRRTRFEAGHGLPAVGNFQ